MAEAGGRREVLVQVGDRLLLGRGIGGDVNQRFDVVLLPRLGDDDAAIGVTNKHNGAGLPAQGTTRRGHVIGDRVQRVLDGNHL